MDTIRCKFFDDDGNPIGPGCRFGHKCRYIHPGDSAWSSTMPYKGPRSSDYHRRNSSRGDSPPSAAGWASTSRSRKHSSSRSKDTDHSSSWFTSTSDPTARPSEVSIQSPVDQLSGWGAAKDSTDTWSSGWNSGGWGGSETKPAAGGSASQWSSAGWGEKQPAQQSNAIASSSKTTPSINRSATDSPSILAASPALSRHRDSVDHLRVTIGKNPASSLPDVEMRDDTQTPSPSTLVHISRKPLPTRIRPPLPTRINTGSTPIIPAREAAENTPRPPPLVAPQDWTRIPLSGSITGRVRQEDMMSDASESIPQLATRDPKDLYAKLIREVLNTVIIRYRLLKSEEKKTKWRNARASACYHHCTPAAQKKLEVTNHQYSEDIVKLNKQLNSSLKKVTQCSDAFKAQRDLLTKGFDQKKVLRYTDELREWIADLELPRRIFAAKASIQKEKEEREAFKKRNQEEVATLKNAIYELELKATDIWDDFCHLQQVQPKRFKEEFVAAEKAMKEERPDLMPDLEKTFTELDVGKGRIEVVRVAANKVDEKLNNHLPKVEQLREQIRSMEKELVELRSKDKEIKDFRQQAGVTIQQLEQWKVQDKERLDQFSQKIENLHKLPRPRPAVNQPQPVKADGIAAYIDELVKEYVAEEIKPALDAIAEACKKDNRLVSAEFNKLLKQVVVKTYDLVQTALSANGFKFEVAKQPG